MEVELLEVRPSELKFVFEVKKQSSCSLQLLNKSTDYVAFKVKTTAPKKYCVKPNVGIVPPKTTYYITVTMQAQRVAPSDMQCKDKFLVQTTTVPSGTTEDLDPRLFSRESGNPLVESKLRVILVSPSQSPEKTSPLDGSPNRTESPKNIQPIPIPTATEEITDEKTLPTKHDAPTKIADLESKLQEAEKTIARLSEKPREQPQVVTAGRPQRRRAAAKAGAGFPFLFVIFVAAVAFAAGYLVRS
ncbi:vesicle-associated protein 1-2-like isoform X2 [Wolffia australiana]